MVVLLKRGTEGWIAGGGETHVGCTSGYMKLIYSEATRSLHFDLKRCVRTFAPNEFGANAIFPLNAIGG